ncbi:hypothetical protein LEN26_017853 [Aphanomyces euteiches]|nr:hypothetical protein LEN26_017853 [Aphanomyces euteiches]KAH9113560.1 hypothetical protein AeMF1_012246 [Aphanomyces euteiches]KAH9186016.1 hypothetical protein AeNC1_012009 [Aphanomyces euteiches]
MGLRVIFAAFLGCLVVVHGMSKRSNVGDGCRVRSDCGALPSLACLHGDCNYCLVDADCADYSSDTSKRCVQRGETTQCMTKGVFAPFSIRDAFTAWLAVVLTALSAACGLASTAGFLVPVYVLALDLTPHFAVPLSEATRFGMALAASWRHRDEKHPYASHRPLIDFALAGMMTPATLIGTIFGVLANLILPSWIILVLLMIFLVAVAHTTIVKASKLQYRGAFLSHKDKMDRVTPASNATTELEDFDEYGRLAIDRDSGPMLRQLALEESDPWPFRAYICPLVLAVGVAVIQALLRGGNGTPSLVGVVCNSKLFWGLLAPPVVLLALMTIAMARKLQWRTVVHESNGARGGYIPGDVHWNYLIARVVFPVHCFFAGVATSLVGLGGGLIHENIMLEYGTLPDIQTATSAFMLVFISAANMLQYALAGQFPGEIQYDFMWWYVLLGFVGGMLGTTILQRWIERSGRLAHILYIVAGMSILQAIAMGLSTLESVLQDDRGVTLGFSSLCGPTHW